MLIFDPEQEGQCRNWVSDLHLAGYMLRPLVAKIFLSDSPSGHMVGEQTKTTERIKDP